MEKINLILSGILMPALLIGVGIFFGIRLRFFYLLHPVKFAKTLAGAGDKNGISPARALMQALAGTLGVGNMAGVATAITAGGAGAVFWMWVSAVCAMSVKYAEVTLGVIHRRRKNNGYFGGAMYYVRDILSKIIPSAAPFFGGVIAILCMANSLLTGNIVQMKAASEVFSSVPPLVIGAVSGIFVFMTAVLTDGNNNGVSAVCAVLIPVLSVIFIVISLAVIIGNIEKMPSVLSEILKDAFSFRAVCGGTGGFVITRAIRFGTTRGVFSNEAGCGTSPTAHAAANVKSPHHQGCYGIFEVFADTIVLCSMTAFVILLSGDAQNGLSGIPLTLFAYSRLAGDTAGTVIGVSVILFAFSTVICQTQYGCTALGYFSSSPLLKYAYFLLTSLAAVAGCVINTSTMWQISDFVISLMTTLNVTVLLIGRKEINGQYGSDYEIIRFRSKNI